ncbi:aconitate hydratase AcnA [Sporosarcina sp. P12(2017)]|uniref:aconitate hydratase AcnA n=1 Tax=unclassified Sporosarcina TaxID=2647733 RepID=UPI000C16B49F|nr:MULTISPECIES: aconitate hydratase AcnA [unclassified Sporosarcina]PIC57100.1 aconitate hydratase AcnA [Sporosarcina sp. P10]PIC60482.1 aconitate hydratase AcnA [Sporosarcina sp. P12(2017)]
MKRHCEWHRDTLREELTIDGQQYSYVSLKKLKRFGFDTINSLPYTIRLLLESAVRHADGLYITDEHIAVLANWSGGTEGQEVPFKPARIVFQDFTGIPAIVDLASMRDAVAARGGNPLVVNPQIPVDLVIDHSVIIEHSGDQEAFEQNLSIEYERNAERYSFVRWAQKSFENFHVVPPANGIVHQVNLEYLATGVRMETYNDRRWLYPDSLVGTDSHTPMINGVGIVGWGVGGIEAESAMLGQPLYFTIPDVVGVELTGSLADGVTATDLALTVTNTLRKKGVVGKFVEFYGEGLRQIPVTDRATIANMAPEYGATMSFFPTDERTMEYFRQTGREDAVPLVEGYLRAQGLFMDEASITPRFSETVELDLATIVPTVSGPKRPQDTVALIDMKQSFETVLVKSVADGGYDKQRVKTAKGIQDGSIVLASITSCTNTSNPSVMVAAGLLAACAVEKGLHVPSYVKTTLTPGSRVVTRYLEKAELLTSLEQLGFFVDGYGCATCCGNSGSLMPEAEEAIAENDLVAASILSGNRNFEGRVHPLIRANYLASPPLVVAYALAGRIDIDFYSEPIGIGTEGQPVYLADVWPSTEIVQEVIAETVDASLFREEYAGIYSNETWESITATEGMLYNWDPDSTYIQRAPYFDKVHNVSITKNTEKMIPLLMLGDSITTDHISPAGQIPINSEAGKFLSNKGISPRSYNNYGARRGNHHVMMRGTFANIRLRNQLIPGVEGGYTIHRGTGEQVTVFEAAQRYEEEQRNLIVLAGKEYGTGSSRDWAAKGTSLLGVKVVLAESFERIHRSNLSGMGVLPLQFVEGESVSVLGLDGTETYTLDVEDRTFVPGQRCKMTAVRLNGEAVQFTVLLRIDNMMEKDAYLQGGLLPAVAESMMDV